MNTRQSLEIERQRLTERFEEQPEGRVFAPLADCHRKLGNLDEALQICLTGLARHPNYSSAHVILGKIHLERGDDASAREAFEKVLELDAQNLLALRQLAEMAEAAEDLDEAENRWSQVAAVELDAAYAEERLQRIRERRGRSADPVDASEDLAETSGTAEEDAEDEHETEPETVSGPEERPEDASEEPFVAPVTTELDEAGPEGSEELEGPEAFDDPGASEVDELPEIHEPAAQTGPPEIAVLPDATDEPAEADEPETTEPPQTAEAPPRPSDEEVHDEEEPGLPPGGSSPRTGTPPDSRPSGVPTAEIATMTLAEIYAEQGFRSKAAEIYRQILDRNPDAAGVRERLERLEAEVASGEPERPEPTNGSEARRSSGMEGSREPEARPSPPIEARTSPEAEEMDEQERFSHFRSWLDRIRVDEN